MEKTAKTHFAGEYIGMRTLRKFLRAENGSAFIELIQSVIILGWFFLVMIAIGSLLEFGANMRLVTHVAAQGALVAYDRNNFASETMVDANNAQASTAAQNAVALIGSTFTGDGFLETTASAIFTEVDKPIRAQCTDRDGRQCVENKRVTNCTDELGRREITATILTKDSSGNVIREGGVDESTTGTETTSASSAGASPDMVEITVKSKAPWSFGKMFVCLDYETKVVGVA